MEGHEDYCYVVLAQEVLSRERNSRRLVARAEEIQKAIDTKQAARERKMARRAKRTDSFATLGDLLKEATL